MNQANHTKSASDITAEVYPTLKLRTSRREQMFYVELDPDHRNYKMFLFAHRCQDHWSMFEHYMFWDSHLNMWPARRGRPSTPSEELEQIAKWLRQGYSKTEISKKMGRELRNISPRLWDQAQDHNDIYRRSFIKAGNYQAQFFMEEAMIKGAKIQHGNIDEDYIRKTSRQRWLAPYVFTADELGQYLGSPEPFSSRE